MKQRRPPPRPTQRPLLPRRERVVSRGTPRRSVRYCRFSQRGLFARTAMLCLNSYCTVLYVTTHRELLCFVYLGRTVLSRSNTRFSVACRVRRFYRYRAGYRYCTAYSRVLRAYFDVKPDSQCPVRSPVRAYGVESQGETVGCVGKSKCYTVLRSKWNERFSLANQWSTSACSTTHAHAQGQNGIVSRRISTDSKQGHIKIAAPILSLPAGMSRVRPEGAEQLLHLRRAQVEAEVARAAWLGSGGRSE